MQKLEKILEEIELEKKRASLSRDCSNEYAVIEISLLEKIENIIRNHMDDGWIPVEDRLPKTNADGMSEDVLVSFEESNYIIIAFYNSSERRWNIHIPRPYIGRVIAWRPLPEPYCPEGSDSHVRE